MQFIVPQFIDVENKIIGPISTRQFIIILVAGGLSFIFYKTMNFLPFLFATIVVLGIGAMFAFVKVNGQQFHYFLLNIIQTVKKPRLRTWQKYLHKAAPTKSIEIKVLPQQKIVSSSHLAEISLMTSTGGVFKDTTKNKNNNN